MAESGNTETAGVKATAKSDAINICGVKSSQANPTTLENMDSIHPKPYTRSRKLSTYKSSIKWSLAPKSI